MCGRYAFVDTFDFTGFGLDLGPENFRSNFNVSPGHLMPVVVNDNKHIVVETMRWGFIPPWSKDPRIGYKMINTRTETVFEKPTWKKAIISTRCIVPAFGFYEWKKIDSKTKQPFMIRTGEDDMHMAGIYSLWKDAENVVHGTFSILTTTPNKEMGAIHNRSPVFIQPGLASDWLDPDLDPVELQYFMQPIPDGLLNIYPVSPLVGSTKNNYDSLIQPFTPAEVVEN